jgi:hypothetical protein
LNGSTSSSAKRANAQQKQVEAAPVRFTLAGPSRSYDPVHQAIRPDLADVAEADHHFAPHYAEPVMCVANVAVDVRDRPTSDAEVRASLSVGSGFALLDLSGGWAWGYALSGHIVGYVPRGMLDLA